MRARNVVAGLGIVALAAVSLRTWLGYYPSSDLVTAIGLPGPSANIGTRCARWERRFGHLHLPTRRVTCSRQRGTSLPRRYDDQQVDLDLVTRRIQRASRIWTPSDSLTWQRALDSVRVAVHRRGGVPLRCTEPGMTQPTIHAIEHWRVGDHTERLIAYHWTPESSLNGEWRWQPWLLQLDAYPAGPPDCAETRLQPAQFSLRLTKDRY